MDSVVSKLRSKIVTPYVFNSFLDWLFSGFLGLFLSLVIFGGDSVVPRYQACLPGYTTDSEGNYVCGDSRSPLLGYPEIQLSITASQSLMIGWAPFFVLIFFNLIVYNISYLRNDVFNIPTETHKHHRVNTSLAAWFDVTLRGMMIASGMTTLLIHVLKFVLGRPRPNAYTLLDRGNTSRVFVSFASGHIAIGYTNCFLFCLWAHRAVLHLSKEKFALPADTFASQRKRMESKKEYFNGNYWFLLPLWKKLHFHHVPSLLLCVAWSPMIGATYIGITRIKEYWHTEADCIAGALIGIACAYYFVYERYRCEIYGTWTRTEELGDTSNSAGEVVATTSAAGVDVSLAAIIDHSNNEKSNATSGKGEYAAEK